MNEGHSAFLALERIRLLMQEQKLTFEEASKPAALTTFSTTHTRFGGIDIFDAGMIVFLL